MRKISAAILATLLLSFGTAVESRGAVIATWNAFNGSTLDVFGDLDAPADSKTITSANIHAPAPSSVTTGNLVGKQPESFAAVTNFTITLNIGGSGLSGFIINYDVLANDPSGTPLDQTWSWSIDGVNFFTTGFSQPAQVPFSVSGLDWTAQTVDFSGVTTLNGETTVYFMNTLTTVTGLETVPSAAGFDNINIEAVPEPVNVALIVFGLSLGGFGVGRRLCLRLRQQAAGDETVGAGHNQLLCGGHV